MVEVDKYIRKLLYEQDCVIIPDFGGLLTHYTPAGYEEVSQKYVPSSRNVAFNEVLKMDDGLLAQYISLNEGISREQAQQCIHDFVVTALSLIRKNKVITLIGVGNFHLNEEGRLVFEPELTRNFHTEFYGLNALKAVATGNTRKSYRAAEPLEEEQLLVQPLTKTSGGWLNWASAAVIAGLVVYVSAVLSQKPGTIDTTSSMNPFTAVISLFQPADEEREQTLEVVDKSRTYAAANAVQPEVPASPEAVVENLEVENTLPEATLPEPSEHPAASNRFYIITSVYESESLLEKYGNEVENALKQHGFNDISTLQVKGRYLLSAAGYPSWSEASKDLPKLKKHVAKGAWIYKVR